MNQVSDSRWQQLNSVATRVHDTASIIVPTHTLSIIGITVGENCRCDRRYQHRRCVPTVTSR